MSDEAYSAWPNRPVAANPAVAALARNDQGALAAQAGDVATALDAFRQALAIDPPCIPARCNLTLLEEALAGPGTEVEAATSQHQSSVRTDQVSESECSAGRIAIISFFFNWPTSGGGNIHTAELARFLAKAGYSVRHFYPCYPAWGIGNVTAPPFASEGLAFTDKDWNIPTIQSRLRQAVDAFRPDWVLITDSWNIKPHLAEAMDGYPVFLRFQALECLCPLNNVRLLCDATGRFRQCPKQQLASPDACRDCLQQNGRQSGPLHKADRELSNDNRNVRS